MVSHCGQFWINRNRKAVIEFSLIIIHSFYEMTLRNWSSWVIFLKFKKKAMNRIFYVVLVTIVLQSCGRKALLNKPDFSAPQERTGMKLVWNDEFNTARAPDTKFWKHEKGFVRNNELQWYQPDNASCKNGVLLIEAKRTDLPNPNFIADSQNWTKNRPKITFTSTSINTRGNKEWLFGTFIIRAKIDTTLGSWPAIWTLGVKEPWPANGEIDIMEFYRTKTGSPIVLANFAWGTGKPHVAKWNDKRVPLSHFTEKNKDWVNQFHIWRMDWDENSIKLYLDDELMNETSLTETVNPVGKNPFMQPHYFLLNLAIGGDNGGQPHESTQSIKYEVDYVRVYQKVDALTKNEK